MICVKQLQYVVIGAKDLKAWERFAVNFMGMTVSSSDENALHLRCDRVVSRVQVVRSEQEDVHAIGWSVGSEADLDAFAAQLRAAKIPYETIAGAEAFARRVLKLLRLRDPDGIVHELAWGVEVNDVLAFKSSVVVDGFASEQYGLGHVVLSIANLDQSLRFFRDVLGQTISAHLYIHGFQAIFLRCNRRHHSVAISMSNRPTKLQHLQIEYNRFDDLGRAMDRAEDLRIPVVASLGKHVSDWVTSFYVKAPSNLTVEIGYGARLLPDEAPTEFENFSGSIWGHRKGMENA